MDSQDGLQSYGWTSNLRLLVGKRIQVPSAAYIHVLRAAPPDERVVAMQEDPQMTELKSLKRLLTKQSLNVLRQNSRIKSIARTCETLGEELQKVQQSQEIVKEMVQ